MNDARFPYSGFDHDLNRGSAGIHSISILIHDVLFMLMHASWSLSVGLWVGGLHEQIVSRIIENIEKSIESAPKNDENL